MNGQSDPPACIVERCPGPAAYAFLAVTGEAAEKIVTPAGVRIRSCKPHLLLVVDQITAAFKQLPDGGPARIRTVPLVV